MSLPEIKVPDKDDLVAVKRANNTMAARKSRQKQINHLEKLEREVEDLSAERDHWRNWAQSVQEHYGWVFPQWIAVQTTLVEEIMKETPR